jgi:hypothetical protein
MRKKPSGEDQADKYIGPSAKGKGGLSDGQFFIAPLASFSLRSQIANPPSDATDG